jgi:hypothetical protein
MDWASKSLRLDGVVAGGLSSCSFFQRRKEREMKFHNVYDPPMTEERDVMIPYVVIAIDESVLIIQTTIDKSFTVSCSV